MNNILDNGQILSTRTKYTNDPKYIHIQDTFRILGYLFVHHLDVWKNAAKKMEQVYSSNPLNAGNVYKSFMLIDTTEIFNEQAFRTIQNTFTTALSSTSLKNYVSIDKEIMFECCKYFFIPCRLNTDTIPNNIKEISLRNWLLVIMTIPFSRMYCDKYYTIVDNIPFLYTVYDQLEQSDKINGFINTLKFEWIKNNAMCEAYTTAHATQVFIRVFIHVSLLASIEILKVYNPTIIDANVYNPNYDGTWIIPMDPTHMEHLNKLHELFKFVNTVKYKNSK
jgi:hypothetical protein